MILGYLSGEWLILTVFGLVGSWALAVRATASLIDSPWLLVVLGLMVALLLCFILRIAGKTPVGITYEFHPAVQGHPRLSMIVAMISVMIWAFHIFA